MERGSRFYDDDSARAKYLAHRQSGAWSPNVVMEDSALVAAAGSLAHMNVADLGCGDGATAQTIMDLGAASYLVIDGAAGMVDAARQQHVMPGVAFVHEDIEDVTLGHQTFDLVISRMAFHSIESLGPVLDCIRNALRPNGRVIFTVSHPVITSHDTPNDGRRTNWIVDDYFVRGPRSRPWFGATVTWHHRTITDYVSLVLEHGFRLNLIDECEPDPARLDHRPDELQRRRRVPLILLVAASLQ